MLILNTAVNSTNIRFIPGKSRFKYCYICIFFCPCRNTFAGKGKFLLPKHHPLTLWSSVAQIKMAVSIKANFLPGDKWHNVSFEVFAAALLRMTFFFASIGNHSSWTFWPLKVRTLHYQKMSGSNYHRCSIISHWYSITSHGHSDISNWHSITLH